MGQLQPKVNSVAEVKSIVNKLTGGGSKSVAPDSGPPTPNPKPQPQGK